MKEFDRLVEIVTVLRSENGCPWDKEQTLYSMKNAMLEEAYELLHALDTKDIENIQEELGDVLLHVAMHSTIADEEDYFSLADVINGINDKLVRRHPHVFANETVDNVDDVKTIWNNVKQEEKRNEKPHTSILDCVPEHLPTIMKAQKIQKCAAKVGFDWDNVDDIFDKLQEEIDELKGAYKSGIKKDMQNEIGDVMFVIANLASHMDIDAAESLRGTISKFRQRFAYIERSIKNEDAQNISEVPIDVMEKYWQEAKGKE